MKAHKRRGSWALNLVLVLGLLAVPLGAVAGVGDVDPDFGIDGSAVVHSVQSEVGVRSVTVGPGGETAVTYSSGVGEGSLALVSADGAEVATVDLAGSAEAGFGPDGSVYAAVDVADSVTVTRLHPDGSVDTSFGPGGSVAIDVDLAFAGDVWATSRHVVVAGGTFDLFGSVAWLARFLPDGRADPEFGSSGVVEVVAESEADFLTVVDVHGTAPGYVTIVLNRGEGGDVVTVVGVTSRGAVGVPTTLGYPGELFSVASLQLPDGSVVVAIQVTDDGIDTFHLSRFHPDGTRDVSFVDPALSNDEVGGPVHLTRLRTGEIVVAYNVGPDAAFVGRLIDGAGAELDSPTLVGTLWMYGMALSNVDGGLRVVVDEEPTSSAQPDGLSVIRLVGDESGRFIDDDGSVHESDIESFARRGVTRGCNPPLNDRFCPEAAVTRGEMAAFLVRALGLEAGPVGVFSDVAGSVFVSDIESLAGASITRGCNPPVNDQFCPEDPLTRAQMSSLLVRALPGQ